MKNFLKLEDNSLNIKYFIILIILAYLFSIGVRLIWVYQFNGVENFLWNNQLMINTNDGYFWAEGARDILRDKSYYINSPINSPISILTAFLYKILPFSLESIILYMPTFLGSLLIVPIMLIARMLKQDIIGFIAALLASITWSYYNRTMTGYYDTDLFVVVLPTLMIWGLIFSLEKKDEKTLFIGALLSIIGIYWHTSGLQISNAIFGMLLIYTILFDKKNLFNYKLISIFVISLASIAISYKLILLLIISLFFIYSKNKIKDEITIFIIALIILLYLFNGGIAWINTFLNNAYVLRVLNASELDYSLKFFNVVNTVREASHISFETFANRISGSTITFILSTIGYLLIVLRYKLLIISLPMVGLGFFAYMGGLRFTVFAIPFMALGGVFLIFLITKYLTLLFDDKAKVYIKNIILILSTIAILYPNIKHIQNYKVPTVFQKSEVNVLDRLKKIASREDYVLTWWDYGYPIRYYSDVKTLIDGGKHDGKSNFSVAFALTNNQIAAANMARLDVEFTELGFKNKCGTSIECILKAYKVKNPNNFFNTLNNKSIKKPAKTRDIYFYLPNRMLSIFPTVDMFSNLDILTGQNKAKPFFYVSKGFQDNGATINLGNNIILNKKDGTIQIGNYKTPLNYFAITQYDNAGKLRKKIQQIDKSSKVSVIFMKNYKQFLVLDNRMFNSSFIQLFTLENYDKDLFEPVILTPLAKVYKLKI